MSDPIFPARGHMLQTPGAAEVKPDPLPSDQQRIRVLESGHRLLAEQLAEVAVCLRKGETRMGSIETELATNSKLTQEVRDILSAAKGAFKVLGWLGIAVKWIGGITAALTTIYVAGYTATHGGKPPWP